MHATPSIARSALLALLMMIVGMLRGQHTLFDLLPTITLDRTENSAIPLAERVALLQDPEGPIDGRALLERPDASGFQLPATQRITLLPHRSNSWLAMKLFTSSGSEQRFQLRFEAVWDTVVVHMHAPDGGYITWTVTNDRHHGMPFSDPHATIIRLAEGVPTLVLLNVRSSNFLLSTPMRSFSIAPMTEAQPAYLRDRGFQLFWSGVLLLMLTYLTGSYYAFRDRAFLDILAFIVVITFYFLHMRSVFMEWLPSTWSLPLMVLLASATLNTAASMFASVTGLKEALPGSYRSLMIMLRAHFLICVALVLLGLGPGLLLVFHVIGLPPLLFGIYMLIKLHLSGHRIEPLLTMGFLVGVPGGSLHILGLMDLLPSEAIPANILQISVGIMLIFFVLAVSRRIWRLRREESQQREAALRAKLEKERVESEMRERVARTEMAALRSQMNPHFIFNALNSINAYVQQNEQEKASVFLTRFARVMRSVLENSRHSEVPLADDLDALRGYMELEQMRMNGKFDFTITVDPAIDPDATLVPPLVVQPFVENAIWHGIGRKEGTGRIALRVERREEQLVWIVEDDGIGRDTAALPGKDDSSDAKREPLRKTSLGTTITRARLDLVREQHGGSAGFQYVPVHKGTRVEVEMPLMLA